MIKLKTTTNIKFCCVVGVWCCSIQLFIGHRYNAEAVLTLFSYRTLLNFLSLANKVALCVCVYVCLLLVILNTKIIKMEDYV